MSKDQVDSGAGMVMLLGESGNFDWRLARFRAGSVERALEDMWRNSQNDFNPAKGKRSSMVGDIFKIREHRYFVVMPFGFKEIDTDEARNLQAMSSDDRWFYVRRELSERG